MAGKVIQSDAYSTAPAALSSERTGWRTDASTDAPSRASRTWILFVALLVLPIGAGGLGIYWVGFQFRALASIRVAPNPAAPAPVSAATPDDGPLAVADTIGIDTYKTAMVDTLLALSAEQAATVLRGRTESNAQSSAARKATKANRGRLTGWDVSVSEAHADQLQLEVHASTTPTAENWRERVIDEFRRRLELLAGSHTRRARELLDSLNQRYMVISDAIASLPPADKDNDQNESGAGAESGDTLEPLEAFQAIWRKLEQPRQGYVRIRQELDELSARRRLLTIGPTPVLTDIDPDKRRSAYDADVALQEDLRHLQVQLAQVRRSALRDIERATPHLDKLIESMRAIAEIATSKQAADWTGAQRSALESVSDVARQFHDLSEALQLDWSRLTGSLDNMPIEPGSSDILDLYDNLTARIGDFHRESERLKSLLDESMIALSERPGDATHHHLVRTEVEGLIHEFEISYSAFVRTSGELANRRNYLLDAALRSSRGLLHRIRARRDEIDRGIEESARTIANERHGDELADLESRIEDLRLEATQQVDVMLAAQQELRSHSEQIPGYVDTVIAQGITTNRRELLVAEQQRLAAAIERAKSDLSSPVSPDRISVIQRTVDRRPINLTQAVSYGLLAWSFMFIVVLAANRVVISVRSRRDPSL